MMTSSARRTRRGRDSGQPPAKIRFDVAALDAAAFRKDAGADALVSRAFLADVLAAVLDPSRIVLLGRGDAPTPMAVA